MLLGTTVASLALGSCLAFGQTAQPPATPLPELEAVSIKPSKSGDRLGGMHASRGGRLNANNVTLEELIRWAYQVRDFQISGAPGWVNSERYDVAAKGDGNPRYDALQPELETMFQSVLVDRFKLAFHRETRELPVYSLVVAKNGPKIHAVEEGDCPEVPTPVNPCRFLRRTNFAQLTAQKAPLAALAIVLAGTTNTSVTDKPGLKGSFSYKLDWTPYLQPPQAPIGGSEPTPPVSFDPSNFGPAISTVLQEQLGLKLDSTKGPVEILVIDHAERPSEN
jgi:bla regulator protein blaR1